MATASPGQPHSRLWEDHHLRGDIFRRMVVNGRVEMTPEPSDEAVRQLRLRHALAADAADAYFSAGFTVVLQDVILGADLPEMVARIASRPLFVVVLAPRPEVVAQREQGRAKTGYVDGWTPEQLDAGLHADTPRLGLWLDTSTQTPRETVEEILTRVSTEGAVG
jgi:chloramphenicol 3-O-phosphotransferase